MLALNWTIPTLVTVAAFCWMRFVPDPDHGQLGYGEIILASRFATATGLTAAAWGIYLTLQTL
jgi:hypothetical protein